MTLSSIIGSPVIIAPKPNYSTSQNKGTSGSSSSNKVEIRHNPNVRYGFGGDSGLLIECSSRPNKKATAHHMKTRPKKTQPWDIKRKPTVYDPLPPLPPDWTLVSSSSEVGGGGGSDGGVDEARVRTEASLPPSPSLQEPVTSG